MLMPLAVIFIGVLPEDVGGLLYPVARRGPGPIHRGGGYNDDARQKK